MSKLSICLPSLNEFNLKRTLFEVYENTQGIDYEIIVVSPFKVSGANLIWVPEAERGGPGPAQAMAYRHATGDYIAALTDDVLPLPGWAQNAIPFVEENERRSFPFAAGLAYLRSPSAENYGVSFGSVYGRYFPFFPFMSRKSVEAAGGWILPEFRRGFTDVDLGLRVWHHGGACRQCMNAAVLTAPFATIFNNALDVGRNFDDQMDDLGRFLEKWKSAYGQGWPDDFHSVARNHYGYGDLHDGTYFQPHPPER